MILNGYGKLLSPRLHGNCTVVVMREVKEFANEQRARKT